MAYQVDKFNGTFLTSVEDGTIDTTTDIRFVGRNYAGYGEVQNENFLHILENFANATPPPRVITGQIWYDSGNKQLKYYNGVRFKTISGAEVGNTSPSGLEIGEFWWDSSSNQLYAWAGSEFVLVGPETDPALGVSGAVPDTVKDTALTNHAILKLNAGGEVIGIISPDAFTLSNENPITGFSIIKKGFNLKTANENGITSDNWIYWGTASNSLRLEGLTASEFVKKSDQSFSGGVAFDDDGLTVGDQTDIKIFVNNGDETIIQNQLGNPLKLQVKVTDLDIKEPFIIDTTGIVPGTTDLYTIGNASLKYASMHATNFVGSLFGNIVKDDSGLANDIVLNVSTQEYKGKVVSNAGQTLVNNTNGTLGYTTTGDPNIFGILQGSVIGNVQGTASNASRLTEFLPSIQIPTTSDKTSVVVRDNEGKIYGIFEGTSDKADRLLINDSANDTDPNYRSAKTTKTANTIAARDSSGNLKANIFDGTATAARYADLAEKYLTDKNYDEGTVVMVGGEMEVTACTKGSFAIGVVSTNPAFMMNAELENGTYIALKGRVPVKVGGKVKKGDKLVSGQNGYAISNSDGHVFAIALDSNDNESVKLVEAVIL